MENSEKEEVTRMGPDLEPLMWTALGRLEKKIIPPRSTYLLKMKCYLNKAAFAFLTRLESRYIGNRFMSIHF